MHRAGSIVRSQARRKRRPPTAYLAAGRRSTAQSALNAVSAGLSAHRPRIAAAIFDADLKQNLFRAAR
jgi:hypothetical protein